MDELSELLTAIRAVAELMGVYRDGLIKNGFTRKEAIGLCKSLQIELIGNRREKQDDA